MFCLPSLFRIDIYKPTGLKEDSGFFNCKADYHGGTRVTISLKNKLEYGSEFKKEKDYWLGHFVIPFSTLEENSAPKPGTEWRFNLARRIRREGVDALRCEKKYGAAMNWGFHAPAFALAFSPA